MTYLSNSDLEALFPTPEPPPISTGRATSNGVSVSGEGYADAPNIAPGSRASGQPVITLKVGRQQTIIGYGGFHTP